MRKLFVFMMVSVDGFFEGEQYDLSWHNVDAEFNQFALKQLAEVDMLMFGRKTYQLMANYWPTDIAKQDDPLVGEKMNAIPKIVASRTMEEVTWENTRLVDDAVEEVKRLKNEPGKDIAIFGSSNLSSGLIEEGLIDEIRIMVSPVLINKGSSVFGDLTKRTSLHLDKVVQFSSGNVLMYYTPKRS